MFEKFLAALTALTEALIANTAALGGKAATKSPANETGDEKPAGRGRSRAAKEDEEEKPARSRAKKVTREDVTALMNKVKDDLGQPAAKALIKKIGKVDRLAEVDDEDLEALFKAATAELEEDGGKGGDDDNL